MLLSLLLCVFHCTCAPPPAPAHDYHVSKTNLRYVAEREQLQVEMHLFVDDLEAALREAGAPLLDLGTPDEHADSERYLMAYLDKHFRVTWNEDRLALDIIGYELEDDMHGLWVYLAAGELDAPGEIEVKNSILTEAYADQKNIVKLFEGERRIGTLLMDRATPDGRVEMSR